MAQLLPKLIQIMAVRFGGSGKNEKLTIAGLWWTPGEGLKALLTSKG